MGVYLRTRGWRLDYRYLGVAPDDFWWRAYRPVTDPERPTILLESDGASWRMYVAGIASERLDVTDGKIQFTLAADGDCAGPDQATRDLVLGIIALSVADLGLHDAAFIDGARLDKQLPRDEVERMLASSGAAIWERAAGAVRAAYQGILVRVPDRDQPGGAWIGGAGMPAARDAFVASCAGLLGGEPGRALALNLFQRDTDAWQFPDHGGGGVSVLVARPGPQFDRELGELVPPSAPVGHGERREKGGAPPGPTKPRPPNQPRPGRRETLVSGSVILVIAVIALMAWQLWPGKQTTGSGSSPTASPATSHSPVTSPSPSVAPGNSPSPGSSPSRSQPSIGQHSQHSQHGKSRSAKLGAGRHKPTKHGAAKLVPPRIYRIAQGRRVS